MLLTTKIGGQRLLASCKKFEDSTQMKAPFSTMWLTSITTTVQLIMNFILFRASQIRRIGSVLGQHVNPIRNGMHKVVIASCIVCSKRSTLLGPQGLQRTPS